MFCVRTIGMMWCVPIDRNAQDVPIQCHADELMCMIWCAMSFTFEHSGYPQVNRCMHHVLQWDWWTTPVKNAIKKPPTPCRAHEIMRMMYHDVMRWEPQQCFTVHILLHDSIWLQSIVKKGSAPRCSYEIMRINECVVEHKTIQRVNKLFLTSSTAQGGGGRSKRGNLQERFCAVSHGWQSEPTDGPASGWRQRNVVLVVVAVVNDM